MDVPLVVVEGEQEGVDPVPAVPVVAPSVLLVVGLDLPLLSGLSPSLAHPPKGHTDSLLGLPLCLSRPLRLPRPVSPPSFLCPYPTVL